MHTGSALIYVIGRIQTFIIRFTGPTFKATASFLSQVVGLQNGGADPGGWNMADLIINFTWSVKQSDQTKNNLTFTAAGTTKLHDT